jgi:hypothetical protein
VKSGDSLWSIAQAHLGGGSHWNELFHANQAALGGNPSMLHPGQHLTLTHGSSLQDTVAGSSSPQPIAQSMPAHHAVQPVQAAQATPLISHPQHAPMQIASSHPTPAPDSTAPVQHSAPLPAYTSTPNTAHFDSVKFTHAPATPDYSTQSTTWRPEVILQNH